MSEEEGTEEEKEEQNKVIPDGEQTDFFKKVKKANKVLDKVEKFATQTNRSQGYEQKGYNPQYVIEAVSAAFGPDNIVIKEVKHDFVFIEPKKVESEGKDDEYEYGYIEVKVIVGLRVSAESPFIYRQARGGKQWRKPRHQHSATESAKSSAIKKALSRFNIGDKAYKGEL